MSGEDPDERKANALKQSLDYIDIFLDKVFIMIMMVMTFMMVMTNEHKKTLASTGAQSNVGIIKSNPPVFLLCRGPVDHR